MATALNRIQQFDDQHPNTKSTTTRFLCIVSLIITVTSAQNHGPGDVIGWENLYVTHNSRVASPEKSVDQKASNARQCYKMCWLFTACSAVTFNIDLQRCQLHLSFTEEHKFRTVSEVGSMAANMEEARMVPERGLYACDLRPCRQTEMCAPVKNQASHICIPILSVFCNGDPPQVANSHTQSDGVGSVTYTCAYGHFRGGNNHISSCDRDTGLWSDVDVTCTFVNCGEPPSLHGAKAIGVGTTVNSEVTYECLAGAVPSIVQIKITCEGSTGNWSQPQGSCLVVSCGQAPTLDTMDVEVTPRDMKDAYPGLDADELQVAFGAEAKYWCKPGYIPQNGASYISQCQSHGEWSSTAGFMCSPVDCDSPPHVANSTHVNYTTTTFGENARVLCRPGFSPLDGITLTCDETGNWAGETAACTLVDCGEPRSVEGAVAYFEDTKLHATVQYKCIGVTAMEDEENSTAICLGDGEWSPVSVTCLDVPCGAAPVVENSDVTYNYTDFTFTARYTCDDGYVLNATPSTDTRKCEAMLGVWYRYSYIACEPISCGPAPDVQHADVVESGQHFPSKATYTCEAGFVLTSSTSTRSCDQSGSWSQEAVTCEHVTCGTPSVPSHAELVVEVGEIPKDHFSHGKNVTLKCVGDHVMLPVSQLDPIPITTAMTCLNGTWTKPDPIVLCSPCDVPLDVPLGTWSLLDESPVKATYSCPPGYNVTGTASLVCAESTRIWHGDDKIRCDPVDCGEPVSPGGGAVFTPEGTRFNATATSLCNYGYVIIEGDLKRTCDEQGTWSGFPLQCEAWNCTSPPDLWNGTVSFNSTSLGSSAEYSCNAGFFLSWQSQTGTTRLPEDPINARCNEARLWVAGPNLGAEELFCDEVLCPPPPDFQNANLVSLVQSSYSVNMTSSYECRKGYKHLGLNTVLTCTNNGTWSYPFFECLRIDCGRPQSVENANFSIEVGTTLGAEAVYTCNTGFYHASNQETRRCGLDGLWTNEFIECVRYDQDHCGDVVPIDHSSVDVSSLQWSGVAVYFCDEGYKHSWMNALECLEFYNSWTSYGEIRCLPVDCGNPPPIPHANAFYENSTLGSHVVYECESGRELADGNTKICTSDGSWSAHPVVECLLIETLTCGSPPYIDNSLVSYRTTTVGSVASYTCNYGFIKNVFHATCETTGHWKFEVPHSCLPVSCGTAPAVDNSESVHASGMVYRDVAVYVCIEGYTHTGSSMKTCEGNGSWSTNLVECMAVTSAFCGDPPRVDFAIVEYESRLEGASATYSCIADYTNPHNTESFCGSDRQWSDPGIKCTPVMCQPPTALNNSVLMSASQYIRVGRSALHICLPGFVSSTNSSLLSICLKDGTWSEPGGYCQPTLRDQSVDCSSPPVVQHSTISQTTGTHAGSMVHYSCEAGYESSTPPEVFFVTCLPEGTWSSEPLECIPTLCVTSNPTHVENAELTVLQHFDNSGVIEAVYECYEGYSTDGKARDEQGSNNTQIVQHCADSWWGFVSETCSPVDCGVFQSMEAFQATADQYTTTYGTTIELACKPPFYQSVPDKEANTNKAVACQANGTWSRPHNFACELCDQIGTAFNDPNGIFTLDTALSTHSDVAHIACITNYHLIGPYTVQCGSVQDTPTWVGLDSARCVRAAWPIPNNQYAFPIHQEAILTGMFACASITFSTQTKQIGTFFMSLLRESNIASARVEFNFQTSIHYTLFQYQRSLSGYVVMSTKHESLFTVPETADLCIYLNTTTATYTLLKDYVLWMSMPAFNYNDLARLQISDIITVNSVDIQYI